MSTQSNVIATVILTGDIGLNQEFETLANTVSPGQATLIDLPLGDSVIDVPDGGSSVCVGVIIAPPTGNTNTITLKGSTTDTGLVVHPSNPTILGLATNQSTITVTVASTVSGMRLVFF